MAKKEEIVEAKASKAKEREVPEFVLKRRALQNAVFEEFSLEILGRAMEWTRAYVTKNGLVPEKADKMIVDAVVQKNLGYTLDAIRKSRTLGFVPNFVKKEVKK